MNSYRIYMFESVAGLTTPTRSRVAHQHASSTLPSYVARCFVEVITPRRFRFFIAKSRRFIVPLFMTINAIAVVVGSLCLIVVLAICLFAIALCRVSASCKRDFICLACGREFNGNERMARSYCNRNSGDWDKWDFHCPYCYSTNLLSKEGDRAEG